MDTKSKIDDRIIECLLLLLDSSRIEEEDVDRLQGKYQSRERYSQDMQTAYYLKKFTDGMPGGFFIYHADGNEEIIYANEAMWRLFNCDSMEEFRAVTGNSFRGIVHPDELEAVEESIIEQIENSQYDLDFVEYRIIPKDGGIRWIDDYGHFVKSDIFGGIFYVFVGDSTERKRQQIEEKETLINANIKKEQQLKQMIDRYDKELQVISQEHLRGLEMIEGLSIDYESIFYVDLDKDRIKAYRVSRRFRDQFIEDGQTTAFIGFDAAYIQKWVCPEDRDSLSHATEPQHIREKLSADRSFHVNYRIFQDGKTVYMQLRMVNVGSEEHISQIVLGYRNVDAEIVQEMEQKQILEEALREATLANSAKNLFLSNMSHDIRTPMNAIVGFTALIKKYMDDQEKVSDYLDMISTASDQLLQLLGDVLEISRIESGKSQVEENECSLLEIAHQVQMEMLPQAAEKNITLSLDVSGLDYDHIYTDKQKLTQILLRLVDNAVKYTKVGGNVSLTVVGHEKARDDGHIACQFMIKDSGIGIKEDFLEQLYKPFEREKNTTLSGIYGTGLGLTITKHYVELMGGTIDVESTMGKGSRFIVTLPLRINKNVQEHKDEGGAGQDTLQDRPETRRILIVDDNEINREIEYEVLKDVGYLVDTAVDGSIAVKKVQQSEPGYYDLILMDIQMPIMDGYHATKAIRQIEDSALAGIPIIAVSANAFEEDKRMAIESGMNAHLAKPLDTARLYKMIRKFLKTPYHITDLNG